MFEQCIELHSSIIQNMYIYIYQRLAKKSTQTLRMYTGTP